MLQEIEKEIEAIGEKVFVNFDNAFHRVDTIELPNKNFGRKRVIREISRAIEKCLNQ